MNSFCKTKRILWNYYSCKIKKL